MKPSLVNKSFFLMLLDTKGKSMKPIHHSLQKIVFKKGKYAVTCLAAEDSKMKKHVLRRGKYTIKGQGDHQLTLWCEEQTGQFKGEYRVTFKWINNKMGKTSCISLKDGSAVNGIFEIAA